MGNPERQTGMMGRSEACLELEKFLAGCEHEGILKAGEPGRIKNYLMRITVHPKQGAELTNLVARLWAYK